MRARSHHHFLDGILCCRSEMPAFVYVFAVLCVAASAAPPKPAQQPTAIRPQQQPAPVAREQPSAQLQQADALDYYLDHPQLHNYYQQQKQEKKDNAAANPNQPSRLETLEPDSEVELLPGAQQPHQPPQQVPVAPNLPGLAPGQRVFIVHMPIPGYRPGTIGGYQPVYIVAAGSQGPQGNIGFAGTNGYQSAVLVNPSYQLSPQPGYNVYPRPGIVENNLLAYNPTLGYNPGPAAWWQAQGNPGVVPPANLRIQPAKLQASESLSAEQN